MNGRDYEPTKIMTHFESDYGAATRVEFTKGADDHQPHPQPHLHEVARIPRHKSSSTPNYPACRSQIDMAIDGDWRKLLRDMQGFHTVTCYGDYLREVGYALKRTGIAWENLSAL